MKKTTYTKKKKKKIDSTVDLELTNVYKYTGKDRTKAKLKNNAKIAKHEADKLKQKYKKGSLGQKILILFMLFLIFCLTIGIIFTLYIIINSPKFDTANLYSKESSVLLDKNGNEFARLGTENRELVTYEELPQVLIDAIVSTEDSRYFQHNGVDLARFTKAVLGQLAGRSDAGGGSTLTMQVVKNTYTSTEASGIAGIIRKFTDIYMAVFKVEKHYTKEQIIEFYVNIPYLGSGAYGVEQAAQIYFNKSIDELSLAEAALIAGLFQAPGAYDPYHFPEKAEARRKIVLDLMYRHGYITETERDIAKSMTLDTLLNAKENSSKKYQGYIDTVVEEVIDRTGNDPATTSMTIYTTLDTEKQDVIEEMYKTFKWKNEKVQAGIAVVSAKDGSIEAVGAGRNKVTERSLNYATSINRHPGSTAKPIFDYGPVIEYLDWSTGQTVVDDKYTYSGGGSIKNWDNDYEGIMTAVDALGASRNIPALYAYHQLSQEQIKEFVTNLGIKPEYENGYINESHSIGGFNGVSPLELAAAYATFARGGTYIEPYSVLKIEYSNTGETYTVKPKKKKAMSDSTAFMVNSMLRDAVSNGHISTGSSNGTQVASKTGTSTVDESIKKANGITGSIVGDAWQVSYSADSVISLWYGYDKISKDYYLTQNEGNSNRRDISKILGRGILNTGASFKKPTTVVSAEIELETDPLELASEGTPEDLRKTVYFKKGTVPSKTSTRFAKLDAPTNLDYTITNNTLTITWTGIPTPKAIDTTYLQNYFSKNIYANWADKYLNERINYNNTILGGVAYSVFMNGTYLGNTTQTNYTYNGTISTDTEIKIKTTYVNYNACDSDEVSIIVSPNIIDDPVIDDIVDKPNTEDNTTNATINVDINISGTPTKSEVESMYNSSTLYNAKLNGNLVNTTSELDCSEQNKCILFVTYKGKTKNYEIKTSD